MRHQPRAILGAFGVSDRDRKAARSAGYADSFLAWALQEAAADELTEARADALGEIADAAQARALAPVDPDASDGALRDIARRRADLMLDRIADLREPVTLEWLSAQVTALEARELPPFEKDGGPVADQLAARVKRACCRHWWARNVRRAATRKREAREQAEGRISVRTAVYVGDDTAARYERQQQRNRATLEQAEIESADGELLTLWAAMQASTANPAIRRGELMTRIKGAEQWAAARGMVGLFTTNTAPSRFHATHHKGGRNHRYTGDESRPGAGNYGPPQDNSPREAQGWLCSTWARTRAALARYRAPRRIGCAACGWRRAGQTMFGADLFGRGVQVFGFRVAEPHHDGCPHWHMLLFVNQQQAEALQSVMRAYWLADHPDEPGADEHRFKVEPIDPKKGGAVAYVAKYIAKNIDDAGAVGAEGHRDEAGGEQVEIDGAGGNKARRVLAWASAWGIRQFQAIGQPPVTVWRELRRVDSCAAQGASQSIKAAHAAVNREGDKLACWRGYLDAQGGAMKGRAARVRLFVEQQRRDGIYGPTEGQRIVGVHDVTRPGEVVLSSRKQWKPRGTWTADTREAATLGDWGAVRNWLAVPAKVEPLRVKAAPLLPADDPMRPPAMYLIRDGRPVLNPALPVWELKHGAAWRAHQAGAAKPAPGVLARPQAAQPWTRVNNCTQRGGVASLMRAGIVGATMEKGPGGLLESDSWTPKPPPPSPNAPPNWLKLQAQLRSSAASATT